MGDAGCVVLEGRDIGTVVFPNAELKIFLIASTRERARRRALELKSKGIDFSIDEIEQQIIDRDNYDSSRKNSPLLKAEDAIEIDTTGLTIEQQTEKIVTLAKGLIGN
jgi:cytidylate kinase